MFRRKFWDALKITWLLMVSAKVVTAGISCLSNPCLHGICIDDVNTTYSCYCVDGYTGVQCQMNWDECWSDPCLNGGSCYDGIASYNCSCPDGFIGDNCETNYNECESNPCQNNGTCIDMTNSYVCSCISGFSGEHCEVDIAVCNTTEEVRCYNGGQCIEGPGFKFYCKCLAGWAGPKCEEQIDECESNPCLNGGICIDVHADYMCACTYGYTGKSCEVLIEFCDDNSCSQNSLCVVEDGIRVCYCVPDFHGDRCEFQYDECLLGPGCMNGGTCIDGIDNFTCSCLPKLTGSLCECLILEDGSYDCEFVSPTIFPVTTQLVLLTSITEGLTTDVSSTYFTEGYNNIAPKTAKTNTEIEVWMSTTYTATETTTDLTTHVLISSDADIATISPTVTYIDTTTPKEIYDTSENVNQDTIKSDDSKLATTKVTMQCQESCANTTDSIISALDIGTTSTTTEIYENTISSTNKETDLITLHPLETITADSTVELSSTPKIETTTDKMFTHTPTEHTVTDIPTSPLFTTPESVETAFDNITTVYSSMPSECTDSFCNSQGTCSNTPNGIRCLCNFKYTGKNCEDKISIRVAAFIGNSYIAHRIRNTTSINIEFTAKTLLSDGQIMHVDIAKDVYMQLNINSGLLKFKFSCGYQTMLLSELKTFVNKGFAMKIETRLDLYVVEQHCNATIRLNDTVAMSGGQVANITSLDNNTMLYLGNTPKLRDVDYNKPFIGCLSDLMVNGESREVFGDALETGEVSECESLSCLSGPCLNGGSCSDQGYGYTCSCANGWTGDQCKKSICENNPCQSGGSCVPYPGSGFLCLCPYGKHGIFCEFNVEITRASLAPINNDISSYLIYPLSSAAMNSERFDLRLRFETSDTDQIALLAFIGQNGKHDSRSQHLALTFVKGYLMLTWNMGNGPRRVFTSRALSDRRGGHSVRVWRRGRTAGLSVDGRHNVTGNAPAHHAKMSLLPYIFVGGHPSQGFHDLPHDLPLHNGWRGCIWEISGQAIGTGKAIGGRGVGQCGVAQCTAKSCNAPRGVCIHSPATYGCICNEGWFGPTCSLSKSPCDRKHSKCQGKCVYTSDDAAQCDCPYGKTGLNCDQVLVPTDVLFTGARSFVRLHPRPISSVSLSLEVELRPTRERGVVVFAQTPHFCTALSLQGGLLEYRWIDHLSGLTSLVRSGVVLSMSQWHSVKAGRYGSRLYVWVDGSLSTEAMLAHAYPHTASQASIVLGGAENLAILPFDVVSGPPEFFVGCIRNLHINNILIPLEQQNIQAAQNIGDCDGTPCGVETCGGNTCVIENGQAKCSCNLEGSRSVDGGRCRRHVPCNSAECSIPSGICKRGVCVCSAGYAGRNCENKINITIPQFSGNSVLILGRKSSLGRSSEQLGASVKRPGYVTLNFTTADLDGLLLWISMGIDYLGIGLEDGALKLVWSLHHTNSTLELSDKELLFPETSRILSRIFPSAGFLSDGEWHKMVLRLEAANISLSVDELLAYVEEPGLSDSSDSDVDLFLGGITEEESAIAKSIFPHNFKGCIDNIATNEDQYVTNYTEVYSENIKTCQLFPTN